MPIYEYRCGSCGNTLEAIQKFSDRPLRKCPECAGRLEKLISRTSFQLKGSGWFASDYSSGKTAEKKAPKDAPEKSTTKKADDD